MSPRHSQPTPDLSADQNLIADLEALDRIWNPPLSPYTNDPVKWVHEVAKEETWSKQREILTSIQENRYTAVKSCHGPGKSFTASRAVAWWLDVKPDAFAITSAPTSHQVRTVLWREVRRAKKLAQMPGQISQGQVPEWKIAEEIVAFGRKPADYLDPNEAAAAFQGIHATHLLVVLDEGSGIPEWLANACETLITNETSRLLIIGNPDNPTSYFAKAFKPGSGFNQITIKASDTPAFTKERVSPELLSKLTSKVWVDERKRRWGQSSPLYMSKVDAEFPTITDDTVFTPGMIADCVVNDRSRHAIGGLLGNLGFDVARLGADESVVYSNRSGYIRQVARWSKADTMETVGRYRRLVQNEPGQSPPTNVDATGLGAGIYDRLRELGYNVAPFNGGEQAHNPLKYKNRRAEAYWYARTLMEEGLIDIDELDEDLQAELLEVHFKTDSGGRTQIEPKEDIAQRLGRSPDRADAFVMSLQDSAGLKDAEEINRKARTRARGTDSRLDVKVEQPRKPDEPKDLVGDLMEVDF